MIYESSDHVTRRRRQRRLWPLVAALWAAVGLSPCALAAVGELDCLHCPEQQTATDRSEHDGHAAHDGTMHDAAGHSSVTSDCGDDCSNAGDTLVDARSTKSTKDAGESAALPVDSGRFVDTVAIARTTGLDPPRLPPVPGRRPHALFCVYLD